ncbi:Ig-like domain-containing protein, partial [Dyadobacter frigoris]
RAEIKVIVTCATPAPTVVSPVNYNVGATATALPAVLNGLWYDVATGGTGLATVPTPSTVTVGTKSYFVSQTLNGCEGPRAEIKVTVNACTTEAPTVTNVTYCLSEAPIALAATGTALKWYSVAAGGTALASAPIPSTSTAGTTSYYVSQTLNGCEGERAKIDVIVNPQTIAPTVTNVTYCLSETPVSLTATGTALKWYSVVTGGTALASAPIPSTATAGITSYYVSQTVNGCEGTRAKIDVIVNPQTIAPTVTATVKYCFNGTTTALTAAGTALKWYTVAAGGTASSVAPTPSAATAGTTSYYVSQTLNGCEGLRAKIDVIVSPQTPAPTIAASALEYCQSVKAPALSATPLSGATLNWYGTNATGGTPSASAPTPSTDTEGTVTYYVGQTDANGCASARAAIAVKTNVTPKPTLGTSSVAYCQNAPATPLVATGTNLKWYLTLDATDFRTTALIPFTEKVSDYSFYVTQTGTNTCESAKAEIKVHIKPLPSATISGNSSIPLGGTANVIINFTGDAPWSYILSNGVSATTSSANLSVPVSPIVTTTYVVTEVSNSCGKGIPNGSALVTVQIPTLTIGVPSVSESCAGKTFTVQFQQSGSFPDGSTMKAQISTVNETSKFISIPSVINGNVITATIPDTTVKGIYYIRIANIGKDGSLIAAGNVSSGQITVNPLPVATISGATTIYMGATANLKVDLTGDAPWTFSLNNGLTDSLVSTSVNPIIVKVIPKRTTTYTISAVSNQCGSGRGAGSARIQVDPVLGTEPPVVSGDWLKIYPTLVDSKCTVEITSAVSAKEADFEILDLNGRSLFKKSIQQKITEVDFSQRPAGLYLLKVQNGKYTSVQRILKP